MRGTALDRLSREDTEILKLGRDVIRGHTCKVLVLEPSPGSPRPTLDGLRRHVEARLGLAPRFRQRVVQTPLRVANPVWLDDPDFDIARHITEIPGTGGIPRGELGQIIAGRMEERMDRAHPLWHLDMVERLDDGSAVLIWRVHHCLADGTTCVRLASELLWDRDPPDGDSAGPWRPVPAPGAVSLLRRGVTDRAGGWAPRGNRAERQRLSPSVLEKVAIRELRRNASRTTLSSRVGSSRSVAFAQAPLEGCKRAGKAIDEAVTVNDVVLSIIAGAVRSWLGHGADPTESIRVKVPVSLHHPGEDPRVGNHDSYLFVDLPVSEPDPVKRVMSINRETRERKLEHDAETLYRLGAHPLVRRWAMSPRVFTFNVSNVPGPRTEVSVLGARLREMYSLAEIAQHHALRVAVISAAGSLFFGLCADEGAVSDLPALADGVTAATAELLARVGEA